MPQRAGNTINKAFEERLEAWPDMIHCQISVKELS